MPVGSNQTTQYIPCLLLLSFKFFLFWYCKQQEPPTALNLGEKKGFHMDVLSLQMSAKQLSRIITFSSIKFSSNAFPLRIASQQAFRVCQVKSSNVALCESICGEMPQREREKKKKANHTLLFTSPSRFPSPESIMLHLQSYKAKSI